MWRRGKAGAALLRGTLSDKDPPTEMPDGEVNSSAPVAGQQATSLRNVRVGVIGGQAFGSRSRETRTDMRPSNQAEG